jgi:hypothetical protein
MRTLINEDNFDASRADEVRRYMGLHTNLHRSHAHSVKLFSESDDLLLCDQSIQFNRATTIRVATVPEVEVDKEEYHVLRPVNYNLLEAIICISPTTLLKTIGT